MQPGQSLLGNQNDLFTFEVDNLTRPDFGAFTRINLAIDFDAAFGDGRMGSTARFAQAGSLEQLVQLDVFTTHGKGNAHDNSPILI